MSLELGPHSVCEPLELAREVALPNSHAATRFLNGWWPDHERKGWLRVPTGRASIALATDGRGGTLNLVAEVWVEEATVTGELPATASSLEVTIDVEAAAVEFQDSRLRIQVPPGPPGTRYLEISGEHPFSVQGGRFHFQQESPLRVIECSLVLASPHPLGIQVEAGRGSQWSLWDSSSTKPQLASAGGTQQTLVFEDTSWPQFRLRYEDGARLRLSLLPGESHSPATSEGRPEISREGRHSGGEDARQSPRLVLVYVMDALRADAVETLVTSSPSSSPGSSPSNTKPHSTWGTLRAQGVSFENHRSVAPNTLPSTKALHVGRVWSQQGGWALGEEETSLAERFRDAGYRTGLFSNNPWVNSKYGLGQGFDIAAEASPENEGDRYFDDVERIHQAGLGWISSLSREDSVFLYVHVLHPHNPYRPPPRLARESCGAIASSMNGSTETLTEIRRGRIRPGSTDKARIRCLYQAGLEYADDRFGEFLKHLGDRFSDHETLVVATSDHGEELFEHHGVLHGYTLFEEMIRIPLVIWAPGRVGRNRVSHLTSTLDVHDFLAQVAESALATGAVRPFSETVLLSPGPSEGDRLAQHFAAAASVKGGIFSLQRGRWKVVWAPRRGNAWGQGQGTGRRRDSVEVYDLREDPAELRPLPLWNHGEAQWLISQLRGRVRDTGSRAVSPEGGAPEGASTEPEIDEALRRRLKSLGYLE